MPEETDHDVLFPFATLEVPKVVDQSQSKSGLTSLCFLPKPSDVQDTEQDESSSDSDEDIVLRSSTLLRDSQNASTRQRESYLISTRLDGSSLLWDVDQRKMVVENPLENRGPTLLVQRTHASDSFIYQTRDDSGTVSLHDAYTLSDTFATKASIETASKTFCNAFPCRNSSELIVLPHENSSLFCVRDWRIPSTDSPVFESTCSGAPLDDETTPQYGMITSLAMTAFEGNSSILMACGVDAGRVFLHDLRMNRGSTSVALGDSQPILALDIFPSILPADSMSIASAVLVAGMAGNTADLLDREAQDRGTIAILKAKVLEKEGIQMHLRSRLSTCRVSENTKGKPGVNLSRFRPDGRLFAIGGWDHRLRIFDRRKSSQIAILRGSTSSVNCFDWALDSTVSGIFATGSEEGKIHLWRCYADQELVRK